MAMSAAEVERYWTAADWCELPVEEPYRVEIVDGTLLMTPPPAAEHQVQASLLAHQIEQTAPPGWLCTQELALPLAEGLVRVGDLVVHRWPPVSETPFPSMSDVGLVLEVVSPRSRRTDRFAKPGEYAEAGIAVFWRLETDPALVLHTFTLVDGVYEAGPVITATGRAPSPWGPVEVDLTTLPR